MDKERAVEILGALADGVNPMTGEFLPEDCVCNQAEVVRAFYCILNEIKAEEPSKRETAPENRGKPWNGEDDQKLIEMFDDGASCATICHYFKRTEGGIAAQLVRLGKISEREEFRRA